MLPLATGSLKARLFPWAPPPLRLGAAAAATERWRGVNWEGAGSASEAGPRSESVPANVRSLSHMELISAEEKQGTIQERFLNAAQGGGEK